MNKLSLIPLVLLSLAFVLPQKPKPLFKLPKGLNYCYVPSGSFEYEGKMVSVQSYYMGQTEVTNFHYKEFLMDLKNQGKTELYQSCLPDTNAWTTFSETAYMNSYRDYYFSHPAYRDYPVVNVTYEMAQHYCEWLTGKLNTLFAKQGVEVKVRLPHRAEFVRAAQANDDHNIYAWTGNSIQNEKGQYRCNFLSYDASRIHYNDSLKQYEVITKGYKGEAPATIQDGAFITAPAQSYWPNGFGIYNLNGNVAEMSNEKGVSLGGHWHSTGYDVRNYSVDHYQKANPMTGFRVVFTVLNNKNVENIEVR